jgi:hypothetical protein
MPMLTVCIYLPVSNATRRKFMMRIADITILALLLLVAIGCTKSMPEVPTLIKVDAKTESDGLQDYMILYAVNGKFDTNDFNTLCLSLKSNPVSTGFNYIVVFDDATNAKFPNTPFTSLYGLEEDRLKHILAVYEFNSKNGYSESKVYDTNMWTGKPTITNP